jgi:hypothetical protein
VTFGDNLTAGRDFNWNFFLEKSHYNNGVVALDCT